MISEEGIDEMIELYKKLYNIELSRKEAQKSLKQLVSFVAVKYGKSPNNKT